MTDSTPSTVVARYFAELRRASQTGAATDERSNYPALANLLNGIGERLKPKVFCVVEMADHGGGHPDIGLFSAKRVQGERRRLGGRGSEAIRRPGASTRGPLDPESAVPGVTAGTIGRPLAALEVQHVTDTDRRIAALLRLV